MPRLTADPWADPAALDPFVPERRDEPVAADVDDVDDDTSS